MKSWKRCLAAVLVFALVAGMLTGAAFADRGGDAFAYLTDYVTKNGEKKISFGGSAYYFLQEGPITDYGVSTSGIYFHYNPAFADQIELFSAAAWADISLTLCKGQTTSSCYLSCISMQEPSTLRHSEVRADTRLTFSDFPGSAQDKADVEGYLNLAFHRALGYMQRILKTGGYSLADLGFTGYQAYDTLCVSFDRCPGKVFRDMPAGGTWAHDPIDWAVSNGITNGTSATAFSPERKCTRGQIVTFLWRAALCPKAAKADNPFTDVHAGDYDYEAVLWAVEKGITTGVSETSFGPERVCTRGQVMTFLWRFVGMPQAEGNVELFRDIRPEAYYAPAVAWAAGQGIANGMEPEAFIPEAGCTRAQVVTFLYRCALRSLL